MGRWKSILLFIVFLLGGCASRATNTVIPDYLKTKTRLVALLPIDNRSSDQTAAQMVRNKLFEELYFKGYPKIPLKVIDEKLLKIYEGDLDKSGGNIPPKAIGELLGVDAVMYCRLKENKTSTFLFYGSKTIAIACELRSTATGATLWHGQHRVIERNFGFSRRSLQIKTSQIYEALIQECVSGVIKTLPDGPDLLG